MQRVKNKYKFTISETFIHTLIKNITAGSRIPEARDVDKSATIRIIAGNVNALLL